MKHDELQNDLAAQLRANTDRMVWTDTQLGPMHSPRPDIFTMDKSYSRFAADAYEVKASASDLRRDVTSGKWQSYRKYAHRVWFAFPRGMVSLDEIPRECGIILRGDNGWRAARKPIAQVLDTIPRDAWLKLLIESNLTSRINEIQPRRADQWSVAASLRKQFGSDIAELFEARKHADGRYERATASKLKATDEIQQEVTRMKEQARSEVEKARLALDDAMLELAACIGIAPDAVTARSITQKLKELRRTMENEWPLSSAIEHLQKLQGFIRKDEAA